MQLAPPIFRLPMLFTLMRRVSSTAPPQVGSVLVAASMLCAPVGSRNASSVSVACRASAVETSTSTRMLPLIEPPPSVSTESRDSRCTIAAGKLVQAVGRVVEDPQPVDAGERGCQAFLCFADFICHWVFLARLLVHCLLIQGLAQPQKTPSAGLRYGHSNRPISESMPISPACQSSTPPSAPRHMRAASSRAASVTGGGYS